MKTIGSIIKTARRRRGFSIEKLESKTKIKNEFIKALEKEDWQKLPEFTVVSGFVKNIAHELDMNQEEVLAFLRRDYPPRKPQINPKPDVSLTDRFSWSPRLTFAVGVLALVVLVTAYLGYQYWQFTRPPTLEIFAPEQNAIVATGELKVEGKTKKGASVRVNNQPALVDDEGNFETVIEVSPQTSEIEIRAISRSDKKTLKTITIVVE